MDLGALFKRFYLEQVRLNVMFLRADVSFQDEDKDAAWELYIEMLTRIVTQPLPAATGDEQTALDSVQTLFPVTREILRRRGRSTIQFAKVAVPALNQVVRPFTAKWHRMSMAKAFEEDSSRRQFRAELTALQVTLINYNSLLAYIAGVEDLTDLERIEGE